MYGQYCYQKNFINKPLKYYSAMLKIRKLYCYIKKLKIKYYILKFTKKTKDENLNG